MTTNTYILDGVPSLKSTYIPGTISIDYQGTTITTDKFLHFVRGKQVNLPDGRTLTVTARRGMSEPFIHIQFAGATLESPEIMQRLRDDMRKARWRIWFCFTGYLMLAVSTFFRRQLFSVFDGSLVVIMPCVAGIVTVYTFWVALTFEQRKGWHCILPAVLTLFPIMVSIGTAAESKAPGAMFVGAYAPAMIVIGMQMLVVNMILTRTRQLTDGRLARLRDPI